MSTKIDALPFIHILRDEGGEISEFDYWDPDCSGDYAKDCDTGARYGAQLISFMRENDAPYALGFVVEAMKAGGQHGGVEIGFLTEIAIEAMA